MPILTLLLLACNDSTTTRLRTPDETGRLIDFGAEDLGCGEALVTGTLADLSEGHGEITVYIEVDNHDAGEVRTSVEGPISLQVGDLWRWGEHDLEARLYDAEEGRIGGSITTATFGRSQPGLALSAPDTVWTAYGDPIEITTSDTVGGALTVSWIAVEYRTEELRMEGSAIVQAGDSLELTLPDLELAALERWYLSVTAETDCGEQADAWKELTVDSCRDQDGDGYLNCEDDCHDLRAEVFPGANGGIDDDCDNVDDDCDGSLDEDADADLDGTVDCEDDDGDGYTELEGDCDDLDALLNPRATEPCDGVDNNCDGQVDEAVDLDRDGYAACTADVITDCDDEDAEVNPDAVEEGNCLDDDCDGDIDEDGGPVDVWEPNDREMMATLLWDRDDGGAFEVDLLATSSDASDEDWYTFWSDDGSADWWSVSAQVYPLGEDSAYTVELYEDDRLVERRVGGPGERIQAAQTGAPFFDDSAWYTLRIIPMDGAACGYDLLVRSE